MIKQGSASAGSGRRGGRLRGTLVGVQVALCMVLMIGAGLLLRGLQATYAVDPGFDYRARRLRLVRRSLGAAGYSPEQAAVFQQRLLDEVRALPGVDAAAYAMRAPLAGDMSGGMIRLPGESEHRPAELNNVRPEFFSVLGLPILRGRTFTDSEVASPRGAADVRPAIVSASTARNLWGADDVIGRTFLRETIAVEGETLVRSDITLEVVGVVADAQLTALGTVDPYYVYEPGGASVLFVKSRLDFAATASSIGAVIRALDPSVALRVLPLEENVAWWRGISGTVTTLAGALGVLALVLAAVGIYGVVSYSVTRRYREIGIRMALGARVPDVLRMILGQSLRPVVVGAVIGLAAAVGLSRVLSRVLFGVSPSDPVGLGGAALLVLGVAFAAAVLAARPATRTDPIETLRYE